MRRGVYTAALVLAGGSGRRMGGSIPKQFMEICGRPLIWYALRAFEESGVDEIVAVCQPGGEEAFRESIVERYGFDRVSRIVGGGNERYDSVLAGLRAFTIDRPEGAAEAETYVFIHDGARPMVDSDIINDALDTALIHGASVTAVASRDTVRVTDGEGRFTETPDRERVYLMQTPQTFRFPDILYAYETVLSRLEELSARGIRLTDDVQVWELAGELTGRALPRVDIARGSYRNIKVTEPDDITAAEAYLRHEGQWRDSDDM